MTKEKKKKFKIRYIVIIMVIIAIAGGTFVAKQYFSTESKTTKLTFENIGKLSNAGGKMYYCKVREQRSKVIRSINTFYEVRNNIFI